MQLHERQREIDRQAAVDCSGNCRDKSNPQQQIDPKS